jgi:hypothetical protein
MFILILHKELIRHIDRTSHSKFNQNLRSTLGDKTNLNICIELQKEDNWKQEAIFDTPFFIWTNIWK